MSESFVQAFAEAHHKAQAAFNQGDFEDALAGLAQDVRWEALPGLPDAGLLEGRDAVIRHFQTVREGIDWQVVAQEFIDAGDGRVVVHQRGTAKGRATGIAGSRDFFQVWEIGDGGLVVRVSEFYERQDALEAVGLRE